MTTANNDIPDAERRLPHWSLIVRCHILLRIPIPDAERRLPHWSDIFSTDFTPAVLIPDAERRLPHWSADHRMRNGEGREIPDAERRLPHWSAFADLALNLLDPHSRRRKASASLELVDGVAKPALCWQFQTPKGVCLIGAS